MKAPRASNAHFRLLSADAEQLYADELLASIEACIQLRDDPGVPPATRLAAGRIVETVRDRTSAKLVTANTMGRSTTSSVSSKRPRRSRRAEGALTSLLRRLVLHGRGARTRPRARRERREIVLARGYSSDDEVKEVGRCQGPRKRTLRRLSWWRESLMAVLRISAGNTRSSARRARGQPLSPGRRTRLGILPGEGVALGRGSRSTDPPNPFRARCPGCRAIGTARSSHTSHTYIVRHVRARGGGLTLLPACVQASGRARHARQRRGGRGRSLQCGRSRRTVRPSAVRNITLFPSA